MPMTAEEKKIIFNSIRSVLEKQTPPMVVSKSSDTGYELIGNKPVPYGSKKEIVPGMWFSSVVMRKDMVSFHFFPIYFHHKDFLDLIPTMAKYLKGKSCFNFKKPEQVNVKELEALMKRGVATWKKAGYVS